MMTEPKWVQIASGGALPSRPSCRRRERGYDRNPSRNEPFRRYYLMSPLHWEVRQFNWVGVSHGDMTTALLLCLDRLAVPPRMARCCSDATGSKGIRQMIQSGQQIMDAAEEALADGHAVNVYVNGLEVPVAVAEVSVRDDVAVLTARDGHDHIVDLADIVTMGTAESTRSSRQTLS